MRPAGAEYWVARSRDPVADAPRWHAANCPGLPFAVVLTAVHVQHLPSDLARFREIDHCACNVLRSGDRAHRRQGLEEVLWVVFVKRSVNNARRDRIEADVFLGVLRGQATCDGLETALRN